MFQFFNSLFRRSKYLAGARRRPARRADHKVRLGIDHLEDRLVPAITDMTALALSQVGTPPSTPQHLYLNFDGWTNSSVTNSSISPFSGTQQQIDDIIYQVSEIYAPFNVEVQRVYGNGAYLNAAAVSGEPAPTTIFIGGDPNNIGPTGKYAYSQTPGQFVDYPHASDPTHLLHSDPYNLAFVDPVSITTGNGSTPWNGNYPWVTVNSDSQIADAVAHEAGHTFGLAHVLASPVAEIMSYNSSNSYFANQTFSLTNLNNNGTTTAPNPAGNVDWQGTTLLTQDSFTYLGAVLGYTQYDGSVHVVHDGSVDGYSYTSLTSLTGYGGKLLTSPNYGLGSTVTGSLIDGDFNVYQMTAPATRTVDITLGQHNGNWYDSLELLVYDQSGNLFTTVDGSVNGTIKTTLNVSAGQTYNFVVGTVGADSAGQYSFQVSQPPIVLGPHFPLPGGGGQSTLPPAPPANLTAVASALTHSAESYSDFITAAYQRYLGRTPGPAEVQGWVGAMQQGLSDERVEAGFIGSAEYISDHGGVGAGWVSGMYQDLLGRTPAQSEVDGWVNALAHGMAATDVAYGFAASTEREGQRVAADYQRYLGRAAAQSEIDGWVSDFEAGYSNENVIAGFVGSVEYFQNHGSDATDWLDAAYQDILGRPADAAAYANWLPLL
jgi:hypothetical protein